MDCYVLYIALQSKFLKHELWFPFPTSSYYCIQFSRRRIAKYNLDCFRLSSKQMKLLTVILSINHVPPSFSSCRSSPWYILRPSSPVLLQLLAASLLHSIVSISPSHALLLFRALPAPASSARLAPFSVIPVVACSFLAQSIQFRLRNIPWLAKHCVEKGRSSVDELELRGRCWHEA